MKLIVNRLALCLLAATAPLYMYPLVLYLFGTSKISEKDRAKLIVGGVALLGLIATVPFYTYPLVFYLLGSSEDFEETTTTTTTAKQQHPYSPEIVDEILLLKTDLADVLALSTERRDWLLIEYIINEAIAGDVVPGVRDFSWVPSKLPFWLRREALEDSLGACLEAEASYYPANEVAMALLHYLASVRVECGTAGTHIE